MGDGERPLLVRTKYTTNAVEGNWRTMQIVVKEVYIGRMCIQRERKKNEERVNEECFCNTQSKVRRFPPIGFQDHSQDSVH